jgi:hypothetical protein
MSEIILSSGAYHKYVSGSSIAKTVLKHGGYSLTTAVLDILAANTCCTKNIVADSVTANSFILAGQNFVLGVYPPGFPQNIEAASGESIALNSYSTTLNTGVGGETFTLADGTIQGQLKNIKLLVDGGGNVTINIPNFSAGAGVTMNDAGDEILLLWNTNYGMWTVMQNSGCTIFY